MLASKTVGLYHRDGIVAAGKGCRRRSRKADNWLRSATSRALGKRALFAPDVGARFLFASGFGAASRCCCLAYCANLLCISASLLGYCSIAPLDTGTIFWQLDRYDTPASSTKLLVSQSPRAVLLRSLHTSRHTTRRSQSMPSSDKNERHAPRITGGTSAAGRKHGSC